MITNALLQTIAAAASEGDEVHLVIQQIPMPVPVYRAFVSAPSVAQNFPLLCVNGEARLLATGNTPQQALSNLDDLAHRSVVQYRQQAPEELNDPAPATAVESSTIQAIPTWRSLIPLLVEVAANGKQAKGRKAAMDELYRLADHADQPAKPTSDRSPLIDLLLTQDIQSADDARSFLFGLHQLGMLFHPDDDPSRIIGPNGSNLFSPMEAAMVDVRMDQVWGHLDDPAELLPVARCPSDGR